jgi:arginase
MIYLLDIPFDFGQSKSGVRNAMEHLKSKGLIEILKEMGPIDVRAFNFPVKTLLPQKTSIKHAAMASLANWEISHAIETLDLKNDFLLNIGGDHGMSLGTIHGILYHQPETVVVWADAHGDINTPETSPSGHFHGMPLAFLLQIAQDPHFEWMSRYLFPEKLILIGPRDLDTGEKEIIEKYQIQYYSSKDLNEMGAKKILEMALLKADPQGECPIHFSLDMDLFDQNDFPSTGTHVSQGPKKEEVFLLSELLAKTKRLKSMDLVEYNPEVGTKIELMKSTNTLLNLMRLMAGTILEQTTNTKAGMN